MFPKIAGLGIGVFVLALFGLRAYRVIDNTETVLLTYCVFDAAAILRASVSIMHRQPENCQKICHSSHR